MAIPFYLAITAAEFSACEDIPERIAWMACHFSAYGTGLSNLPVQLPPGSLLILNDRTPPQGHDPQRIALQLQQCIQQLQCSGLLLDLQRPDCTQTQAIVDVLLQQLQGPVAVSAAYAAGRDCAVFLPPPGLQQPVGSYLAPWQGREIWLEAACQQTCLVLGADGAHPAAVQEGPLPHWDSELCCSYRVEVGEKEARFTLARTKDSWLQLPVQGLVGLYQEFDPAFERNEPAL